MAMLDDDDDDDREDGPTRVDRPVPVLFDDEDSSAVETEVFAGALSSKVRPVAGAPAGHAPGVTIRESPARPRPVDTATVRESPGGAPPAPGPQAAFRPAFGQTVSVARAPLDDQGFGARYSPLGVLGEGGMGLVAHCKDVRIGREVAMKLLRKEAMAKADARMRFEREARVQGQLEHPAIVPVYDLGMKPDGTPFFTMKRLHGDTLATIMDALQKGSPTAHAAYTRRKLLTAFSSVCLAVAFANSRGVLHRDLKPGNVMLGDFGEVYLLDWGLAKLTVGEDRDAPAISSGGQTETQIGEVMGTPGYMSPEQLRGEVDQLDARTDVYALGVILFEMLTLEPLHERRGLDTIYNSTLGKRDLKISERAFAKQIAPEIVAIIVKATALEPKDRYATARELSEAIDRHLEGARDTKQRSDVAAAHAATAQEAMALAATVPEMRELALREAGAALALDPAHAGALQVLSRLMLETKVEMSAEARREFEKSRGATDRETRRGTFFSYLVWMAFVPVVLALGIRDRVAAIASGATVILAALLAWLSTTRRGDGKLRLLVYVLGTLAVASSCTLLGWAIVVPGLAAVHTLGFMLHGEKRHQPAALVLGVLSVIVPFVLQEVGVLPQPYHFEGARMVVTPHMADLPPVRTQIYLVLASLAAIVAPTLVVARLRDTLEAAEERAFMHAWTLQSLVPGRAREAASALRDKPRG